ncbi:MAG: amidohydrolase [Pirellula sp.]|jgi:glucuronate isomerase|nr:amidohydrolase [Pirellula sp.]
MKTLADSLFAELDQVVLIDSHSHINPHQPASKDLADLLGYHYYTELAHSSGMLRSDIEEPNLESREKVRRLFGFLGHIDNTVQWSWFLELAQELFGFQGDVINESNWQDVYELALARMNESTWEEQVLKKSKVEKVFLTNDFDDPLEGFDTNRYIPCLRTDDLVFHLTNETVQTRLSRSTGHAIDTTKSLRDSIGVLFERFVSKQARACAISLPPWFQPVKHNDSSPRLSEALQQVLKAGIQADDESKRMLSEWVFWTITEFAEHFKLPFDLMIGVNRKVYPNGVFQGQDLYDSRISLIQYQELLNAFPTVTFPISVLASVTNQELVDYAWIFPNVVTHGHWWYSNTPNFIKHDLKARIEAIPRNKQIGYYSDAYKLEFILPKFRMYKRILATTLAEDFCVARRWSEARAVELGSQILRGNVETIFKVH